MEHRFNARIERSGDMDAAYVVVPIDIRREYGKGRLKVEATFDGVPYSGSVVNMGVKDADGHNLRASERGNVCFFLDNQRVYWRQELCNVFRPARA